ncbi:MAG: ChbG/HpnK family deacetylase [Bacteroidales bacterium]|nr:ChbG/HpnK family deacetylase [Bacteroidales bacterium]
MKTTTFSIVLILTTFLLTAQENEIRLIIRGDDIGSSHAANIGCIESYKNGIMTSVELMPPCPWFLEATEMLNQYPDLDVGIHLTLTSEWSKYKWKSLTHCPGLTNELGDFYPMVWKNKNFPPNTSIQESDWTIEEIERELRAQIEVSLKYVPHISHITGHMGFASLDPEITDLVNKLAIEYDLAVNMECVKYFSGINRSMEVHTWHDQFCENLEKLVPGTYLFLEHPAKDYPEMKPISHIGSGNIANERETVTQIFTSEKVKKIIKDKGIRLTSYADMKK